jgi:hypothetical protein
MCPSSPGKLCSPSERGFLERQVYVLHDFL